MFARGFADLSIVCGVSLVALLPRYAVTLCDLRRCLWRSHCARAGSAAEVQTVHPRARVGRYAPHHLIQAGRAQARITSLRMERLARGGHVCARWIARRAPRLAPCLRETHASVRGTRRRERLRLSARCDRYPKAGRSAR